MKEQSNFRYDIGLLRALSVLVVVFYHFKVPFFSGGFIGVDVFFVISGFLMTKIILTGFDNQNFNLKIFYINRVKRIIPALLVLLLFVLLISNILFFANDVKINSIYIFLSNFFVSNVYYWLYSGYFDPASHENILLHTWSLSVEWQFYILYPIILLLFRKKYLKKRNLIAKVLILITVFSFLAAAFLTKEFNSFTFYMFPTRAWEMTFGGLAFLYSNSIKDFISGNWKKIIVLFSLVTILLCSMLINESFLWPSYFTIIPVISTFLILTLSDYNNKFFKNKLIQFFGKISYSLYLWHWPIFIIFKYFGIINFVTTVMMLIISMVMAILSYYFVEQNEKFLNYKRVLLFSIIISFLSCLFSFFQ
ncbi:acyltransferase family protein [Flavobacterium sp. GNP001]